MYFLTNCSARPASKAQGHLAGGDSLMQQACEIPSTRFPFPRVSAA